MFASAPDYVFFALSVTQKMKLQGQININIALKKVCTGRETVGILSHNVSDTVKSFKNIVWVK